MGGGKYGHLLWGFFSPSTCVSFYYCNAILPLFLACALACGAYAQRGEKG